LCCSLLECLFFVHFFGNKKIKYFINFFSHHMLCLVRDVNTICCVPLIAMCMVFSREKRFGKFAFYCASKVIFVCFVCWFVFSSCFLSLLPTILLFVEIFF
jgi:hypothetical protein